MSAPRPLEVQLLAGANELLWEFAQEFGPKADEARFQALEATAARMGTHDLADFHRAFRRKSITSIKALTAVGAAMVAEIEKTGIPPALALSALAREVLGYSSQRNTGAYHTDFRLAQRVAQLAAPGLDENSRVIDPACGAGILLTALTIEVCGADRKKTADWLRHCVCAADLSEAPLRGALISLASLTDDIDALVAMRARWIAGDSLMTDDRAWTAMAPEGFDAVVANPPWEKVKLTRHEFLKGRGDTRHYGADLSDVDGKAFGKQRDRVASYAQQLVARYPIIGQGEPDLYMAFLDLGMKLLRPGGRAAILLPGGLIRSQGTEVIRRKIIAEASDLSISILDNKARFFAIDTRFKFLALALTKAESDKCRRPSLKLFHEHGSADGVTVSGSARIGRAKLAQLRPDLSVPEVRSDREWALFSKLSTNGIRMSHPGSHWNPDFCREVDMTSDRRSFLRGPRAGSMPLIEGRHINQHRFGVKGYVSGSGRGAIWQAFQVGASKVVPQFHFPRNDCTSKALARSTHLRAGFCDIAGQTNERSMMAALIPPGVVCGNKVPTVLFPNDPGEERLLVWLAVVNSLTFDWLLRRVLTTTINYFVLLGLPMPNIARGGVPWRRLVNHTKELIKLDTAGANEQTWERFTWLRAQIDAEVALAYGLGVDDLTLMLEDFPLLDRAQSALPGERRSTITRDTLLAAAAKRLRSSRSAAFWTNRVNAARSLGAHSYMPSEIGSGIEDFGDDAYVSK